MAMGSETRKYQPLTEQTEPTTYSAASRANGLKKDRQAHEKQQVKADPVKSQEAGLFLTGIQ